MFKPEEDQCVSLDCIDQSGRVDPNGPFSFQTILRGLPNLRGLSDLSDLILHSLLHEIVADLPYITLKLFRVDYPFDLYHSLSSLRNDFFDITWYLPCSMSFQASSINLDDFRSCLDNLESTFFNTINPDYFTYSTFSKSLKASSPVGNSTFNLRDTVAVAPIGIIRESNIVEEK
jgi:hypothetical protein